MLLYNKLIGNVMCGAHVSSNNLVFSAPHIPINEAVIAREAKQSHNIMQIPANEKLVKVIHFEIRLNSDGGLIGN